MKITVVVCAKNAEKYIGECLESINNQTVRPEKVLLIDDSSEDSTIEIAEKMGVTVIANEGHKLYDARNTALKHCDTELIAFTDSDCAIDPKWVENIISVFESHEDVGGGTGRHPTIGINGFAGWLHRMWFIVETEKTGFTGGVIGGNSYFRTAALEKVGGWISLPYACAEDVYISIKLLEAGYKLWFDEDVIANHHYTNSFTGLMRKTVTSGEGIVYMMKVAGIRNYVWWYSLVIPVTAVIGLLSIVLLFKFLLLGLLGVSVVFGGTFAFLLCRFRSIELTIPRFIARWILIWPYSLGVVKGVFKKSIEPKIL